MLYRLGEKHPEIKADTKFIIETLKFDKDADEMARVICIEWSGYNYEIEEKVLQEYVENKQKQVQEVKEKLQQENEEIQNEFQEWKTQKRKRNSSLLLTAVGGVVSQVAGFRWSRFGVVGVEGAAMYAFTAGLSWMAYRTINSSLKMIKIGQKAYNRQLESCEVVEIIPQDGATREDILKAQQLLECAVIEDMSPSEYMNFSDQEQQMNAEIKVSLDTIESLKKESELNMEQMDTT